jgi:PD-(D/E)XK endonuclease
MNTIQQGAVGVAKAVAYYGEQGYAVFVPISDIRRYDLLVDDGSKILRIEVKTTSSKEGSIGLRTMGGNQSWNGVIKKISSDDCDRVFLVDLVTGTCKEFLSSELDGRSSIKIR